MLILHFHIFQRGFEILKVMYQASIYVTIVTSIALQYVPLLEKYLLFYCS